MKIGLQNAWGNDAEQEILMRFQISAANLGYVSIHEVRNSSDINSLNLDFVVCLTRETPKSTSVPTYHVANLARTHYQDYKESLEYSEAVTRTIEVLATFDGYLTNSPILVEYLSDILGRFNKSPRIYTGYYSSAPASRPINLDLTDPLLCYFGIHWDGLRFLELFEELATRYDFLRLYGRNSGYGEGALRRYLGSVPFDGFSTFQCYRDAGVGLCLHRQEFIDDDMPTNRIFEIAASSAIVIAGRMPFIERNFGNSVLYVDQTLPPRELAEQIASKMDWIRNNKSSAKEMALECNRIFNEKFSIERVLEGIIKFHNDLKYERYGGLDHNLPKSLIAPSLNNTNYKKTWRSHVSPVKGDKEKVYFVTPPQKSVIIINKSRYLVEYGRDLVQAVERFAFPRSIGIHVYIAGYTLCARSSEAREFATSVYHRNLIFHRTDDPAMVHLPLVGDRVSLELLGKAVSCVAIVKITRGVGIFSFLGYIAYTMMQVEFIRQFFVRRALKTGRYTLLPMIGAFFNEI